MHVTYAPGFPPGVTVTLNNHLTELIMFNRRSGKELTVFSLLARVRRVEVIGKVALGIESI